MRALGSRASARVRSAVSLVDWEFFTIDGSNMRRILIERSAHPVYETKRGESVFWWRTPVSTGAVKDEAERDLLIARRWGA